MSRYASVKIPRNQTATMQLIRQLIGSGHYYWCTDTLRYRHLEKFAKKMIQRYPLDRPAHGRHYDRQRGRASVHWVIVPNKNDLRWYLLSTRGQGGLADGVQEHIAEVFDTRRKKQHLSLNLYEVLKLQKQDKNRAIKVVTTWRLKQTNFDAHKSIIVKLAKAHNLAGLNSELQRLHKMPMFNGVRGQVIRLQIEAEKVWRKFNKRRAEDLCAPRDFPLMTFIQIYDKPVITLFDLIEHPERWFLNRNIAASIREME